MSTPLREELSVSSLGLHHPDHACFCQSQWNLPSWAYPVWRLFWCVWHVSWLIVSGVRTQNSAPEDGDGIKWFVYASNWTFLLTTFFCLVDCALVLSNGWRRSRETEIKTKEQSNRPAGDERTEILFQGEFTLVEGMKIHYTPMPTQIQWLLFEAVNCTNLLATIAFWASQYEEGDFIHADVAVFNIVNTVFVVTNSMITGMPVRILHFIYPAIFIFIYFLFNLFYYLADGTAIGGSDVTFRALEWDEAYPTAFTIIAGFLLFIPLGHLFFFSLFTLRIYLVDKFGNESERTISESDHATYRKRNSMGQIEDGGASKVQGRFESSSRVNEGFEMESDNRR